MSNKQYVVPQASSPGSGGGGGSGTVTSVGLAVNGTSPSGIFTVTGSPVTTSGTLNVNLAGTSGGVPYFSSTTVMSSSALLTANQLVLGGGAATAPATLGSLGTTTTVLHGNAAGTPTFGAVSLTADVTGTLPVGNGGTGQTTLTNHGVLVGAAASAITQLVAAAAGTVLAGQGTGADPAFSATPTLGVAGTTLGTLSLTGNTSGTILITPQATAGSPTLTLPNASGTFAISASAPIVLSATTGNLTAPTAVTSAASLTSNAVVLGGGGQATSTQTFLTTNGSTTLTVGVAAGGNGVLALAGNTSGTATLTAPATAGTTTNAVVSSNVLTVPATADGGNVGYGFAASLTTGLQSTTTNVCNIAAGGNPIMLWASTPQARVAANCIIGFNSTASDAVTTTIDTGISRSAAGVLSIDTTAANNHLGLIRSAMSKFVTTNFTTSGVGTALEAITGLAITVPALAANWTFHCHLAYSQNVGNAAVAFGVQAATNNPTNIFAQGTQQITVGPPATVVTGILATLATTTATAVVSGTPTATATNYTCDLYGTCELGASANTINILVSTATAGDTVTILRGSYLHFNC